MELTDSFDNARGVQGYDAPGTTVPSTNTALGILLANEVVNLRAFNSTILRLRTQSDLDNHRQNVPLDDFTGSLESLDQTGIENAVKVPGENWVTTGSTLVTASSFDKRSETKNWRGAKLTLGTGNPSIVLASDMPGFTFDITGLDKLSVVLSLTGGGTITGATLSLTDSSSASTADIALTNDTLKRWVANVDSFTGTDLTKVQKVTLKVTITGATAGNFLYVYAIRAHNTAFNPSHGLGINTTRNALGVPVTFDLADPTYDTPELVRGQGLATDPTPENAEARILIRAGDLAFATGGSTFNRVDLVMRQTMGEDTYILVRCEFDNAHIRLTVINRVAGVNTTKHAAANIPDADYTALMAGGYFWLEATIRNTTLTVDLRPSDVNESLYATRPNAQVAITDAAFVKRRGRIGFGMLPVDRDVLIMQYVGIILGLSTFITKTNARISPVEALQLFGSFSPDDQLFTGFASGATQDTVRTLSGNPSWTGVIAVSDDFIIPEFSEAYVSFDIWVPPDAVFDYPLVTLEGLNGAPSIELPVLSDIQAGIWNHFEANLDQYAGTNGGSYRLHITAQDGSSPLSWIFNIDYMTIGHRPVSWEACSTADDVWYPFRGNTNDEDAALHFPRVNVLGNPGRGSELRLRATALSQNAWIAGFYVRIYNAELGKFT